jgi:streptomycin 6-kinase
MELFAALAMTAEREVLLCTDLHAGNVLSAQREPWLMIDPKPFVGDPCYDVLQHMLNCEDRLTADPVGLARRLADLLELDGDRVARWLFARCVLESVGQPQLRHVAITLAPA